MIMSLPIEVQFDLKAVVGIVAELQFPELVLGYWTRSNPEHLEIGTLERIAYGYPKINHGVDS
jgi:hypothetical protein